MTTFFIALIIVVVSLVASLIMPQSQSREPQPYRHKWFWWFV